MAAVPGAIVPSIGELEAAWAAQKPTEKAVVAPVYRELVADLDTPVSTFLKLRNYVPPDDGRVRASAGVIAPRDGATVTGGNSRHAFLLESVEGGERLARYSIVGSNPHAVLVVGDSPACTLSGDPMRHLEEVMSTQTLLPVPSVKLPPFTGGAVGYVGYDAVRHFEPRTAPAIAAQRDVLQLPESVFMLCDDVCIFDHVRHTVKVVTHIRVPGNTPAGDVAAALRTEYAAACARIDALCIYLARPLATVAAAPAAAAAGTSSGSSGDAAPSPTAVAYLMSAGPLSPPSVGGGGGSAAAASADAAAATGGATAAPSASATSSDSASFDVERASNMGRDVYEGAVRRLKHHIVEGDIIQAVPSHRVSKPLPPSVSSFDIYRALRVINPSPYMFYISLGDGMQIVGASPEMLVKVDASGTIYTHPIAGTRRRGATPEQDDALAAELLADPKERAEHVMLVDLSRNDTGRVAAPGTVRVDSLMHIERYSHVMHIVSNVSGKLAPGKTAYDAFRSIFPAGTVSGAPKVMAVQLVAGLEAERRHVYAGAVGYVSYSGVMDTAIAIRTIVVRDHVAHLQAGAGIVYDSVPAAEYDETLAKMRAVMRAVDTACGHAAGGSTR